MVRESADLRGDGLAAGIAADLSFVHLRLATGIGESAIFATLAGVARLLMQSVAGLAADLGTHLFRLAAGSGKPAVITALVVGVLLLLQPLLTSVEFNSGWQPGLFLPRVATLA